MKQGRVRKLRGGSMRRVSLGILFACSILPFLVLGQSAQVYDAASAIQYANTWCQSRNSQYGDYSNEGGDCANFVSQCLIAGGISMEGHPGAWGKGRTIPSCTQLHDFLVNDLGAQYVTMQEGEREPSWFSPGDVVIFHVVEDPSIYAGLGKHAMFAVASIGGRISLSGHTPDVCGHTGSYTVDDFFKQYSKYEYATYYHIIPRPDQSRPNQCGTDHISIELAAQYVLDAGFQGEDAVIILAIAWAESGGNRLACLYNPGNDSWDRGILQFNTRAHPEITDDIAFDPRRAFIEARRVVDQQGFCEWVVYEESCPHFRHTGSYRNYLSVAREAIRAVSDTQAPSPPSFLRATPISSSQINLSWQDNSDNEQGFKIERRIESSSFSQIATLSANTQSYSDSGLSSATTYCYRVRAYNSTGDSAPSNEACAKTTEIPTKGNPPVANFAFSPADARVNDIINFINQSTDPDGDIVSTFWEFGDGSISTEWSPSHRYSQAGTYTIRLSVRDSKGNEHSTSRNILIEAPPNQYPIAQFIFTPSNPSVGQPVFFDASSSFDPDPGDYIVQYLWDFDNDGHFDADGQTAYYTFSFPGPYTVVLRVTDSRGGSSSQQQGIFVRDVPPPQTGRIQVTATLDGRPWEGSISYFRLISSGNQIDGAIGVPSVFEDVPPGTWTFEFHSGGPSGAILSGISPSATQTLPAGGTITFTLNFMTSRPPEEKNPPRAGFTFWPAEPRVNEPVYFTDQSTDPDNDIVSWSWDFGDGARSSDRNPTHSYSQSGSYRVSLSVSDSKGNWDSIDRTVTITRAEVLPPRYLLSVDVSPPGSGLLAMDGTVIESYPFTIWLDRGTRVELRVFSVAQGYLFNNWEGALTVDPANSTRATIQMDGDRTIIARFREVETPPPPPSQHRLCIHGDIETAIGIHPLPVDGNVLYRHPSNPSIGVVLPGWCGNYLEGTAVSLLSLNEFVEIDGKVYAFEGWTSPNVSPYRWDQLIIDIIIGRSDSDFFVVYRASTSVSTDSDYDGVPDDHDSCPYEPGPSWNNGCPEAGPPPPPPEEKSIEEALDTNRNNRIDDTEILQALEYWVNGIPVPGTGGQLIDDRKIKELADLWLKTRSSLAQFTLMVSKAGTGNGTVTSNPAWINCGMVCSAQFGSGTLVTLTASAAPGSTFSGWGGCDSTSGNQCTVTMNANKTVTATFNPTSAAGTITCPGVTVTSPSRIKYSEPGQTKDIYVIIENRSGVSKQVLDITKRPTQPFTIKSTSPSLPYMIYSGISQIFYITTVGPSSGQFPMEVKGPYFDIRLDCGTLSTAAVPAMSEYQLQVVDLQATVLRREIIFSAVGEGIAGLQVELYDLSGHRVLQGQGEGAALRLKALNEHRRPLANGVYLYVITVKGFDGTILRSEVRKLVILR